MENIEVEIKCLLGKNKGDIEERLKTRGAKETGRNNQLNHYFAGDCILFEPGCSVRTREVNGNGSILVIKRSLGPDSSHNGIARRELEIPSTLSIEELDTELIAMGLKYQAKWSRSRIEYQLGDVSISLDRNAGYGWLVEFEKKVREGQESDAQNQILDLAKELNLEVLSQARLERMFTYYNQNWPEYYGTDKVFEVM